MRSGVTEAVPDRWVLLGTEAPPLTIGPESAVSDKSDSRLRRVSSVGAEEKKHPDPPNHTGVWRK